MGALIGWSNRVDLFLFPFSPNSFIHPSIPSFIQIFFSQQHSEIDFGVAHSKFQLDSFWTTAICALTYINMRTHIHNSFFFDYRFTPTIGGGGVRFCEECRSLSEIRPVVMCCCHLGLSSNFCIYLGRIIIEKNNNKCNEISIFIAERKERTMRITVVHKHCDDFL